MTAPLSPSSVSPSVLMDEGRLVVVDKPSGPTSEEVAADLGLKLCHRLDRLTSGCLVLARDARTVQRWHRALHSPTAVTRTYRAIVLGAFAGARTIESVLVRDRGDGRRGSVDVGARDGSKDEVNGGKLAITEVRAVDVSADGTDAAITSTIVEAVLRSGRTHQVRIHLSEAGFPIVGDPVYGAGADEAAPSRLMLHAWRLAFTHPTTHRDVVVEAPLPAGFGG